MKCPGGTREMSTGAGRRSMLCLVLCAVSLAAPLTRADVLQPVSSGNVLRAPKGSSTPTQVGALPIDTPFAEQNGYVNRQAILKYDLRPYAGKTISSAILSGNVFNNSAFS